MKRTQYKGCSAYIGEYKGREFTVYNCSSNSVGRWYAIIKDFPMSAFDLDENRESRVEIVKFVESLIDHNENQK